MEFDAVNKYDGVIRAIEFVVSITEHQVIDCDSVRAGMIYLCCSKLSSLIKKIASKFDPKVVSDWLSEVAAVKESILGFKLDRHVVEDFDEILFEVCREGDIPCLSLGW
jgi:hypothetical protein